MTKIIQYTKGEMTMVIQYKCPNCGADMAFNAETGMLHCESCGLDKNIENMEQHQEQQKTGSYRDFISETSHQTYEDDSATQYQCKNCGAILITDKDTSATTCSFCDAPMILGDRLSGDLSPSKIIPFSITKSQAEEAFHKWRGKGLLLPNNFKKSNRIKSITGMYVPFWLYDLNTRGEIHAEGRKVRTYTEGDYDVTETKFFDVYRDVDVYYNKIPVDASEKMDDGMMDKLEPYNYGNLQDFNTPYLSGYLAEKYNYTDEDLFPRVEKRADQYCMDYARSTMVYSSVNIRHKDIRIRPENVYYALLPVWMFCYDYEHAEHNFMMNGQTGKIVGKPPISVPKSIGWFAGISILIFIILKVIMFLIGGVWI